ncbi:MULTISPECIES: tyrosine-type recombinase/integrase [Vibrio]|uniref:tyrosine-type recombinase/integrase n=1 Tax=Vibrio TaxID=662 RepID=UPI000CE975FA|nr:MULTISPECIES: site-specific integrase [Vibrio]MDF4384632.1 tyrosine-type recombinase/integrase [Vibrio parahaemolyticus]AVF93977.1 integrase [Vibrio diabolicus]MCR9641872.1 tyrosine-type recombinase/integrase [Vibrio alginolyticus]MDW2055596.1 tyrosine-type recombinase/integrase [Vibrio sp. 506]MDW2096994.1 tyrosine-type recombinase/integrase [Vibrio sp. 1751]
MNNKQLDALIRKGEDTMLGLGDGLYFRIARKKPSWVVKYIIAGKRAQIALPQIYPSLSISEAKRQALDIRQKTKLGIDPKSERKKGEFKAIHNVDALYEDWYQAFAVKQLKHPHIPERYYRKEVKQHIGVMTISDVTPQHIRLIIERIVESGRNSIANKVLLFLKQLFNHAIKLNLTTFNPAQAFSPKDAGGTEVSRNRCLRVDEINYAFRVMRSQSPSFTRDNYLACCLLLCFGCRKGELISAKWEDIDLLGRIWHCIPNKQRRNAPVQKVSIPIPDVAVSWLEELKYRAGGSEYVFPARKKSKRGYISDDTLNHALQTLMGIDPSSKKTAYSNLMPDIEPFTVHDLRRTCRSLLSQLGVSEQVAERCLNHKIQGVVGIYDRYHYLDERREALNKLANFLEPFLKPTPPATTNGVIKNVGDDFLDSSQKPTIEQIA